MRAISPAIGWRDVPRIKVSRIDCGGARFAPRGGGYCRNELDTHYRRDSRQADTRYPHQEGSENRDRAWLPPGLQNAIMYFQDCAEDPNPLPSDEHGGPPTLAAPRLFQRPDIATQGHEVPE